MRTLYLLRHGRPAGDGVSRCLGGRSDPPLSAEGAAECAALAEALGNRGIRAVGSSPLLRCRQTAQLRFPAAAITPLPGLAELDCGDWDGLPFSEIQARWPEHYARRGANPALPPPGGETLDRAAARARAAICAFLAATEGDVALIGHSGVNRALLCALTGTPYARYRDFPQPYLCINLLRWDGVSLTADGVKEEICHEKPV